MLHHRPPPASPASPTSALPRQGSGQSSTKRKKSNAASGDSKIELVWPILLTLLAANFAALIFHVWHFLPDLDINDKSNLGIKTTKKYDPSQALKLALSKEDIVRHDIVPTILNQQKNYHGVVHQLPSIPNRRRMIPNDHGDHGYAVPLDAVRNLTYFLESRMRPDEEDRPLFLYNPMILPLDDSLVNDTILSDLRSSNSNSNSNNNTNTITDANDNVAYVAVYRVSNFGNCHGPGRGVPESYQNYLGLALLDRNLNIVRDSKSGEYLDAVIDLNQHLYDIHWKPGFGRRDPKKPKQYMQDCQLFAASSKGAEKADRLILICNEYAMPVRLQRRRNLNETKKETEKIYFKNTYGTGLQLTALQKPNVIIAKGKNMHYITAKAPGSTKNNGPGFLEIWPGGPHEFLYIDFATYPFVKPKVAPKVMNSNKTEPEASYRTNDGPKKGQRSPLIDRDSGSACCVPVRWKDGNDTHHSEERTLLLGFSHRKTTRIPKKDSYNYVSRVYAFEPMPPFDIVARSGFFCLGFATHGNQSANALSDEALRSSNEQAFGAANDYKLKIHGEEFDCPKIHFVTGIAEKLGDQETVIISYGVNDCYPRMIEVSKKFLVGLLRPDQ